ncbi:hypothetical protein EXIGLDRAFT_776976 [Exidia glandulosa HHB12029]|uniref:Uncharacterized protein n=1 Tax=Exidia glandulosa HHB12029 TaxID=1314781 RepID=A0A165D8W5_EXIGL|nr:hypothetical protein EXIGLDRAFT_776976 [Exidia glandulosa HHB12029]
MFILSSFLWASNVTVITRQTMFYMGHHDDTLSVVERFVASMSSFWPVVVMDDVSFVLLVRLYSTMWLSLHSSYNRLNLVQYLIGDTLIVWRMAALRQWPRWVMHIMFTVWLGTLVCGVTAIGCLSQSFVPNLTDQRILRLAFVFEDISWVSSTVFNFLAVALLAHLALHHRRNSRLISPTNKTTVDRVLAVLATCGAVYVVLGIPRLTTIGNAAQSFDKSSARDRAQSTASQIIECMLYQLVCLYPTAVTAVLFYSSKVLNRGTGTQFGPGLGTSQIGV